MDKLTSICALLEHPDTAATVLSKAVALAGHFGANVDILVFEPLPTAHVVPQCAALGYSKVTVRAIPRTAGGSHADILDCLQDQPADLVVKARSGAHPLRRYSLAPNDWKLAQECPAPLMLVDRKPWSASMRLAATVDVSDAESTEIARAILQTGGFVTLGCRGFVDVLYVEREQHDDTLRMERAVRLAQLVREFHVGSERLQMFDGTPEKRLVPLISARQYDMLLLGAVPHRSGLGETWHSLTSRLVEATCGDVILVKERNALQDELAGQRSAAQQFAHHGEQFV
jgi:nucleotide-binding universal stress UspA family protein